MEMWNEDMRLRQSVILKDRWKYRREEMLQYSKRATEASRKTNLGRKLPQWVIEKRKEMRLRKNNGKYFSDEGYKKSYVTGLHKEKAKKNGYWFSDETRKKMSEARKGRFKGIESPVWKGGITSFISLIRNDAKYKVWRLQVFKRDRFTCQICGGESHGDIEAHHLKSFNKILTESNIITLKQALNCKELWQIDNGVTLCIECHKNLHSKNKKKSYIYI